MTITYYCIDKKNKTVLSSGPVPEVWGNISGMKDLDQTALADLTWANYPDYGFLTREAALALGISAESLDHADYLQKKLEVPELISMKQARLALLNIGKLDNVEAAIVDRSVRIEWEYSTTVNRFNSAIVDIFRSIGMTEDQIDDLFISAKNY
jgi:hypothetical protein